MKKTLSFVLTIFLAASLFAAELTASFVTSEAAKKDSVDESVKYLKTQVAKMTSPGLSFTLLLGLDPT